MDRANLPHQAPRPRQTWQEMADEHAAIEILELSDRVTDLEGDVASYRAIATAGIHALHRAHQREQRHLTLIREQHVTLKALRATVEALRARLHVAERRAA